MYKLYEIDQLHAPLYHLHLMFCNQTLRLTKSSEGDINLSFGFLLACRVSDYRSYNMLVNVGKFYTFK